MLQSTCFYIYNHIFTTNEPHYTPFYSLQKDCYCTRVLNKVLKVYKVHREGILVFRKDLLMHKRFYWLYFQTFKKIKDRTLLKNRKKNRLFIVYFKCCTSSRFLTEDVEWWGIVDAQCVAGSLSSGLIARLVWMPQLTAVVAEFCVAALTPTAQLGTLGTAICYHCITKQRVTWHKSPHFIIY